MRREVKGQRGRRRKGCEGKQKETAGAKPRGVYKCSACAETRDERRSALEDTDTFAGENAEK